MDGAVGYPSVIRKIDAIFFWVEIVGVEFELDVQDKEDGSGHAEGKTCDIDKGKGSVGCKVAQGDAEVVAEHK